MTVPPVAEDGNDRDQWAFAEGHVEWSSLSAEAKHERILCAAGQVFRTQGLEAPMPAVAAAAGAGVGSLYRQFPSKHELLCALVVRRLDHIGEVARSATAAPAGEHWRALQDILWRLVRNHQADDFLGEAFALASGHPDVVAALTRSREQLNALLRAAIAEGAVRADATALDIRLLLTATHAARRMEPGAWERMLELIIDGLRARS